MKKITAALKSAFQASFERTGVEAQDFKRVAKEQIFGPKQPSGEVKVSSTPVSETSPKTKTPKVDSLTGLPIIPKKKLTGLTDAVNKEQFLKLTKLREKLAQYRSGEEAKEPAEDSSSGPAVVSSTDKNKPDPSAIAQLRRNSLSTREAESGGG